MSREGSVSDWYSGKSIFITGGTGFMGKVLIEKLLRCCPGIRRIYVLVRGKRGLAPAARVANMIKLKVFERVVQDYPERLSKLVPVEGDVLEEGLGLSEGDRRLLEEEVQVVFHGAATLRLEADLKTCVNHNTGGTLRTLKLALNMKKIQAFVHFSTAFCHSDVEILEDKIYPVKVKPADILKALEWLNDEIIKMITPSLLDFHPNCYTLSKRLAESVVDSYKDILPVSIVRPSIVIPSLREPVEGWVDSLNGPMGILVAAGKGVLRSLMVDTENRAEVVPVDLAVNAIIPIPWRMDSTRKRGDIQVYNLSIGEKIPMTWGQIFNLGKEIFIDYPFEAGLWYPGGGPTQSAFLHTLIVFLFQTIPAYIIDFIMILIKQKTFMVRVQKRIATGMEVLEHFTMRKWHFKIDNVEALSESMSTEDKETFYLAETEYDIREYFVSTILGSRQYILNEPLSSLPKARRQLKMLYLLDLVTKAGFVCLLIWLTTYYIRGTKFLLNQGLDWLKTK